MTTSLIRAGGAALTSTEAWQTMQQQAAMLVRSGFLPEAITTPEKAIAIILKGQELGIPPMYALSNITIIKGKPTCSAEVLAALIYRDHGDHALMVESSDDAHCTVSYARRSWQARKTLTFTMEDAKRAELLGNATWKKYPAAMLRARALSAVARLAFQDSIGGMYTPEELGATVTLDDATGEMIISPAAPHITTLAPPATDADAVPHRTADLPPPQARSGAPSPIPGGGPDPGVDALRKTLAKVLGMAGYKKEEMAAWIADQDGGAPQTALDWQRLIDAADAEVHANNAEAAP